MVGVVVVVVVVVVAVVVSVVVVAIWQYNVDHKRQLCFAVTDAVHYIFISYFINHPSNAPFYKLSYTY